MKTVLYIFFCLCHFSIHLRHNSVFLCAVGELLNYFALYMYVSCVYSFYFTAFCLARNLIFINTKQTFFESFTYIIIIFVVVHVLIIYFCSL